MEIKKYKAFISYSRKDEVWAQWIQTKLETFPLSPDIIKETGIKQIRPVFIDKTDLRLGDLNNSLTDALENSEYLIVVCSSNSAVSRWVNKEVEHFQNINGPKQIIPFIIKELSDKSQPTINYPSKLSPDILGASMYELNKKQAITKIASYILGIEYDKLWQRHQKRRRKNLIVLSTLVLLSLTLASVAYGPYERRQFITQIKESKIPRMNEPFVTAKENLDSVRSIILDENNISYADKISKYCTNIDTLKLGNATLKDLQSLYNFKNLKDLIIYGIEDLKSTKGINNLENLTVLQISDNYQMETLTDLERLEKIDSLEITYCPKITKITNLRSSKSLRFLGLGYNFALQYSISDLIPIKSLRSLKVTPTGYSKLDTLALKKQRPDIIISLYD